MHIIAQKSAFGKGKRGGFREKNEFRGFAQPTRSCCVQTDKKTRKNVTKFPFHFAWKSAIL
jgi:hypothetical protein